ncbi:tyrosine-protein phosphatase non-receptor type substrate 1-like [Phasianus colchicus]|uniref:tyrosine-protein phosphatase non-receptor type substrate 1-like n=1 Tax=Phasianus colchicus TaxID=9054 RepID=UPI00129D7220|nr:tyrosine-protein phosphatase non-receptor type substrate 1-like [Phasianus colchicus]
MPLTCLVLLLLQNAPGVGAQKYPDFKLQQSQGPVVVIKGEMLTLNCTVSESGPVGPVNWLKDQGSSNQTIYDQKGSSQRVMRAVNVSETDFTIHIRDVRLEDAGTYYCVKFRRNTSGDEVFKSGGESPTSSTGILQVAVPAQWHPEAAPLNTAVHEAAGRAGRSSVLCGLPIPHCVRTHTGAILLSSPGLWLGLLLDKALLALVLFFFFKRFLP